MVSAALEAWTPFAIATNVVCVFLLVYLTLINVSKTSIKIIVPYAERTCFLLANLHKIYHADMQFMLIAFENLLDLTTAAQYARKRSYHNSQWQLHGKLVLETLLNTPCLVICSALLISCAMIAKQRVTLDGLLPVAINMLDGKTSGRVIVDFTR